MVLLLKGWLKSGDAYTSNGVVEFTKQLLAHLPKSQTILLLGDSGFFNGTLFDLLDQPGSNGCFVINAIIGNVPVVFSLYVKSRKTRQKAGLANYLQFRNMIFSAM